MADLVYSSNVDDWYIEDDAEYDPTLNKSTTVPASSKPLSDYLSSGKHVTLYVGPERKSFVLNEDLLCERVKFFEAAFSGNFRESSEKTMELHDEEPIVFSKFVDWLYGVPLVCEYASDFSWCHSSSTDEHELLWCKLFIMADKFCTDNLGQTALDLLEFCTTTSDSEGHRNPVKASTIQYVYQNTLPSSALRQFVIKQLEHYYFESLEDITKFKALIAGQEEVQMDMFDVIQRHMNQLRCDSPQHCRYHHFILPSYYALQTPDAW